MKWLCAAIAALVLAVPASAKPQPLGASWQGGGQQSSWIEQQQMDQPFMPTDGTAITNPFGAACFWSVNDHESKVSTGYIDPGATVVDTKCSVSDYPNTAPYGFATAWMTSKSPLVTLRVCYSPQDRCFDAAPRYDAVERAYVSSFCVRAHYLESDPLMQPITGSNGGLGLVTTITTMITSTDSKRVRDVFARVGYASDISVFLGWPDARGCLPTIPYVDHFEYPFEWTSS